jgi:phosphoribosylformylglycinamidine synthase
VALAESAVTGATPVGCDVGVPATTRADLALFGEGPSRVMLTVESARVREFEGLMAESAIPWRWIGVTGGERVVIRAASTVIDVPLERLAHAWRSGFERHMA